MCITMQCFYSSSHLFCVRSSINICIYRKKSIPYIIYPYIICSQTLMFTHTWMCHYCHWDVEIHQKPLLEGSLDARDNVRPYL